VAKVTIYSDGACQGNPGPGGWGAVLRAGEYEKVVSGAEAHTTNNRMELIAAIKALEALTRPSEVVLITDSEYLRKGMTEWLAAWKRRGWRTAGRTAVKNADLWQQLDALSQRHRIEWRWTRGHNGDPGNERADALARAAIRTLSAPPPVLDDTA
jgi:ribonuclease HI